MFATANARSRCASSTRRAGDPSPRACTSGGWAVPAAARRHRRVNDFWFEDNTASSSTSASNTAMSRRMRRRPLGTVYVRSARLQRPDPREVAITPQTEFHRELDRVLHWREAGHADTHVHFPAAGPARRPRRGVNVVNLLASQWGEMFSNVSDFDEPSAGRRRRRAAFARKAKAAQCWATSRYSGIRAMICPLCTGGPSGQPSATRWSDDGGMGATLHRAGGLVVMPRPTRNWGAPPTSYRRGQRHRDDDAQPAQSR